MKRHRSDQNQKDIIKALRGRGASVCDLSNVGDGCPDILVGFRNKNYLLEIKNPNKPKADQKLTPEQIEFHSTWSGFLKVVFTTEDALRAVGLIK